MSNIWFCCCSCCLIYDFVVVANITLLWKDIKYWLTSKNHLVMMEAVSPLTRWVCLLISGGYAFCHWWLLISSSGRETCIRLTWGNYKGPYQDQILWTPFCALALGIQLLEATGTDARSRFFMKGVVFCCFSSSLPDLTLCKVSHTYIQCLNSRLLISSFCARLPKSISQHADLVKWNVVGFFLKSKTTFLHSRQTFYGRWAYSWMGKGKEEGVEKGGRRGKKSLLF